MTSPSLFIGSKSGREWPIAIISVFVLFAIFHFFFFNLAKKSYQGLVVDPAPYRASLNYQKILDQKIAFERSGLRLDVDRAHAGTIVLSIREDTGKLTKGVQVEAQMMRPDRKAADFNLALKVEGDYLVGSDPRLISGYWKMRIQLRLDNKSLIQDLAAMVH